VTTTVSSGSVAVSSIGTISTIASEAPAAIVTLPGSET